MTSLQLIKITGTALVALMVSSFSNRNQSDSLNDSNETIGTWIDTVILHSPLRENNVSIDLFSGIFFLDEIDSSFFKRHLTGFEGNFPINQEIKFDPTTDYYFFDYQRFDSFVSFAICTVNKSRLQEFFVFTYDLKSDTVTTVSCIASEFWYELSGDYYWYSSDSGKRLSIRSQTYSDEFIDLTDQYEYEWQYDNCFLRTSDSLVTYYEFFPNKTEFTVDTVFSKLDTICV